MAAWPLPVVGLVVTLAVTMLVWLASLAKRDASIIDVFWGLGFVVVGWVYFAAADGQALRQPLVVGLVTLWGVRLSLHILWRNWGRGDWQLARFKRDPANQGQVMNRGLWRYTRHPNYFGDAVVWWSFFCFAAATSGGWWTVVSPVLMTLLLMRVSGVTLLEKKLDETKPAYREYVERTSAFFPWWPADRAKPDAGR